VLRAGAEIRINGIVLRTRKPRFAARFAICEGSASKVQFDLTLGEPGLALIERGLGLLNRKLMSSAIGSKPLLGRCDDVHLLAEFGQANLAAGRISGSSQDGNGGVECGVAHAALRLSLPVTASAMRDAR
jgi:hypothetical protein